MRSCLSWLSFTLNNRKYLWHQPPKCHHSCCHTEPRKSDLEITARYLNKVEAVQHVHCTNIPVWFGTLDCCAISKTDACSIDALDHWCLRMLLDIKWHQFVRNDDVRRLMKQPKLTVQSCRLTLFGHIMQMDDNTDAKRILLASPPADWRRHPGHPRITWLSTVQQDLKHHFMLSEAADLAQNRPLWRMMSTYGATQSELHARNDDDDAAFI